LNDFLSTSVPNFLDKEASSKDVTSPLGVGNSPKSFTSDQDGGNGVVLRGKDGDFPHFFTSSQGAKAP
jgi:hypothetical protein